MSTSIGYKFGKSLGAILIIAYLIAATMGLAGTVMTLDYIFEFPAWYYGIGVVLAGLIWLYFIPRPIDVLLLAPLAVYGGVHKIGLTWTVAMIVVAIPVLIVVLMSLGRK